MSKGKVFIAATSGVVPIDGTEYYFIKDVTRIREGHPLLVAHPDYFKELEDQPVHYEWETATAAPGERRGESPPKR